MFWNVVNFKLIGWNKFVWLIFVCLGKDLIKENGIIIILVCKKFGVFKNI